jgi:DNA-directed RNA polymerase subunit M/transcription elongation factor TFIIS
MPLIKIYCPNCGRILGDTEKSIDANINCRGCKTTQRIKMTIQSICDFYELTTPKEAKK